MSTSPPSALSAGAGSTEPQAPKAKPAEAKAKAAPRATTSSATAGSSAEAAGQKMPKAQTAFFFFTKDARPVLKGEYCARLCLGRGAQDNPTSRRSLCV